MNDFELWEAYCKANERAQELLDEVRKRGLLSKPTVKWSLSPPDAGKNDGQSGEG